MNHKRSRIACGNFTRPRERERGRGGEGETREKGEQRNIAEIKSWKGRGRCAL